MAQYKILGLLRAWQRPPEASAAGRRGHQGAGRSRSLGPRFGGSERVRRGPVEAAWQSPAPSVRSRLSACVSARGPRAVTAGRAEAHTEGDVAAHAGEGRG